MYNSLAESLISTAEYKPIAPVSKKTLDFWSSKELSLELAGSFIMHFALTSHLISIHFTQSRIFDYVFQCCGSSSRAFDKDVLSLSRPKLRNVLSASVCSAEYLYLQTLPENLSTFYCIAPLTKTNCFWTDVLYTLYIDNISLAWMKLSINHANNFLAIFDPSFCLQLKLSVMPLKLC